MPPSQSKLVYALDNDDLVDTLPYGQQMLKWPDDGCRTDAKAKWSDVFTPAMVAEAGQRIAKLECKR